MKRAPRRRSPSEPVSARAGSGHLKARSYESHDNVAPGPNLIGLDFLRTAGTREVPEARPNFDNSAGSGTLRYTNMPGELRVPTNCARQIDLVASRLRLSSSEMGDCIELPLRPHPRQHGIKPGFEVRSPVSGDRN